jgi:tetratricopeptide (TPR) repeat protein
MSTRRHKESDPLERAIEAVLAPGRFVSYYAASSFVEDVEVVADRVGSLIDEEPERATRLYETFIAACHEKADEVDDSGGGFRALVQGLFCGWIEACQTAGMSRDELARSLLAWMEDDPYGYCYRLEREAVKVFDSEGLEAFGRLIHDRYRIAQGQRNTEKENDFSSDHAGHHWASVLKTVLAVQRDIDTYIELCRESGLGAEECRVVADIHRSGKRFGEALDWIERGLKISRDDPSHSFAALDLGEMKRALLVKLGRRQEALESAWAEFQQCPSAVFYKVLMRHVSPKEKKSWHGKAMEAAEKSDLSSQIELWLELKELDRLASRLGRATNDELEGLSHYKSEPAARAFERSRPELAARLYRASAMRVVNAGKSKYYDAALANIERAKKCYTKADLHAEWEALAGDIRVRHRLKRGFITAFEQIASGNTRDKEPAFMERAKRRWPGKGRKKG